MIRIVIADDHQLVKDGLRMLLSQKSDWTIEAEASNGPELMEVLSRIPCEIVITDLSMPGMKGIELISALKKTFPTIPVLVLTMHDEQEIVSEILNAEADGYLLKNSGKEEVIEAIQDLLEGKTHYNPGLLLRMFQGHKKAKQQEENLSLLTPREVEILKLIVAEYNSREIAEKLFISKQTVDTHRAHIMEKTNSKTLVGLIKFSLRHGIEP